jgi:hypothetical protein
VYKQSVVIATSTPAIALPAYAGCPFDVLAAFPQKCCTTRNKQSKHRFHVMYRHVTIGSKRLAQTRPVITIAHKHIHAQIAQCHKWIIALVRIGTVLTPRHTKKQKKAHTN